MPRIKPPEGMSQAEYFGICNLISVFLLTLQDCCLNVPADSNIRAMRNRMICLLLILLPFIGFPQKQPNEPRNTIYGSGRIPLAETPYTQLPVGSIQAKGWLLKMLQLQKDGLTGHLDEIYPEVCGPRNAWLGGDGDSWERGPYWVDGLTALAFTLDDPMLKQKALLWINSMLNSQQENGFFGPKPYATPPAKEPGVQKYFPEDWWPRMVMLKALQQYYSATSDQRVIPFMLRYFKYELEQLPLNPLGKYTWWSEQRGGDNLAVVYWLYNQTGEKFLLQLAEIIFKQTFDWTTAYSDGRIRNRNPEADLHCVNIAQGLKEPIIYYQQHPDKKYLDAVKSGLTMLHDSHGFVNGMYGADENLHGNDPTQGSELCAAVEMMYSFESILPITGDEYYADYLEKLAFNALPAQVNDDFTRRQYFQQVNQVSVTDEGRNFINDHEARNCFGTITGYPCCTVNMHQGWPKLAQNLWYASAGNGLAALVYSACEVNAKVATGVEVHFAEETNYPFSDKISFRYLTDAAVAFPFHLRIPAWCDTATVTINDKVLSSYTGGQIVKINREWQKGDQLVLNLPMKIRTSRWFEESVGVERGPLVYALKIGEEWREVKIPKWKDTFFEVVPTAAWNFGLADKTVDALKFTVDDSGLVPDFPWNLKNAPIQIKTRGIRLPDWTLCNHSAGKIPVPSWPPQVGLDKEEDIILVPYGCTTMRIAEFPYVMTR